jgi:hypothetical protein
MLQMGGLEFKVNSLRWHVWGGPRSGSITAYGDEKALGDLFSKLRSPVEIYDEVGRACWWGYVSTVRLRIGALEVAVSLDEMANKVAVAYSYIMPGTQTVGVRKTTAWAEDTNSESVYGTKEFISSASGLTDAVAEAKRDVLLALRKLPQSSAAVQGGGVSYSGAEASMSATLECRGWWETLGWRYYPAGFPLGPSYEVTAGSTTQALGATGGYLMLKQVITAGSIPFTPSSVWLYVSKTATAPANPITVIIREAEVSGGLTKYKTVFSGTIAAASVGTSIGWVECVATAAAGMKNQSNITYTLYVYGETSLDSTYYSFGVNAALGYSGGALQLKTTISFADAGWVNRSTDADLLFKIDADATTNTRLLVQNVINYGEFITAAEIETASGVDMTSYQDGDATCMDLAEDLMNSGGPNERRLLAKIDINRMCNIYEEPTATATYLMDKNGVVKTMSGSAVVPYLPPVGVYVRLVDLLPATADVGLIADPTLQFIEGAEWSESGGLRVEFRGERFLGDALSVDDTAPRASVGIRPALPGKPRIGL